MTRAHTAPRPTGAPEGADDLDLDRIAAAREYIDPVFLDTPQYRDAMLDAALGRPALVKVETLNPLRSFKGRGAMHLAAHLPAATGLVCASGGGNFGQAVAYAARGRGITADVFVPGHTSEVKTARMASFGARVHRAAAPDEEAEAFAAADTGRVLAKDGVDTAIAEGAGTIGVELARAGGFDTVVLPLGDGALITGVARWLRAHAPGVRVVGAGAAAAPAMARAWRTGRAEAVPPSSSFAAGISISTPRPEAVRRVRALVDDVVLVDEEELTAAMRLAARTLGVLPEPAGAAGLAAIARGAEAVPGESVATVITGANADPAVFGQAGGGAD
ncbi:pyridoxal-phosphate dependent enzyme [Nocardiopsis sp. RSe5-2]|uniref:Pyridoxal-phosphate dependent enzyme n=1 Tax=Nocardiopsis endophytica TaxID=3018445 RepID=A0ABT4UBS8_9ACTN|nr:pyridoxal-phosphate dependent enzyme [Nocardiopsis endophytica]MDA2813830.1 pyridoxal-phosphate dependent enzyme [Nocardiopsis endophytica]